MPQPITLPVVTDACQIVNCQIFSRRSHSPCGSLCFKMADEFTSNTFPFRFTIPPASLDQGAVQTKTVVLDKPTLSCAYSDCGCFAAGLPGLPNSIASSPFVETLVASCERKVVSFGEIRRESVQEKSLKMLRLPPFFQSCALL